MALCEDSYIHSHTAKVPLPASCQIRYYRIPIYAAERTASLSQFLYGHMRNHHINLWITEEAGILCRESGRSRGPGVKPQLRQQICTHQCILINTLFVVSPLQLAAAVMMCALGQKREVRMQDMSCMNDISWDLAVQTAQYGLVSVWFLRHCCWVGRSDRPAFIWAHCPRLQLHIYLLFQLSCKLYLLFY